MTEGIPPASGLRFILADLWNISERQDSIQWERLNHGVEIHRLYGDGVSGPSAALIRFGSGSSVPYHEHQGYEHIFVLSGAQRDDTGEVTAGSIMVHAPGTGHRITSETGCIVLAIYEKPVRFISSVDEPN